MLAWTPVVGLAIGVVVGAAFAGGSWLAGPAVGAALSLTAAALVTGAFHADGLADMADAFGGGWTPDERLAILKDSRHGTYGVSALICNAVVQFAAVSQLQRLDGFLTLVAAHGLGRGAAAALAVTMRPARATGLAAAVSHRRSLGVWLGVAITVLSVVVLLGGRAAITLTGAAAVAAVLVAYLAYRKIGGMVGDVLGAAEQIAESAVLVAAVAVLAHQPGWWR